jgi:hypothetical protein
MDTNPTTNKESMSTFSVTRLDRIPTQTQHPSSIRMHMQQQSPSAIHDIDGEIRQTRNQTANKQRVNCQWRSPNWTRNQLQKPFLLRRMHMREQPNPNLSTIRVSAVKSTEQKFKLPANNASIVIVAYQTGLEINQRAIPFEPNAYVTTNKHPSSHSIYR